MEFLHLNPCLGWCMHYCIRAEGRECSFRVFWTKLVNRFFFLKCNGQTATSSQVKFHNGENRSFPLALLVCAVRNWGHLLAELCKLFFLMLGSKRIPCALKGSGQVLLSATESSAVQAAPHGWRPGQVRVSWTPVFCMSCPGFACFDLWGFR